MIWPGHAQRSGAALLVLGACLGILLGLTGCKGVLNPSVPPEGDADIPVAQAEAELRQGRRRVVPAQQTVRQITLTVNNAPGPDQPLEMEVMQRLVDLFERRNPGIRIQFSPWKFTPESFFDRLSNRTLTDIIEINAAQLPAILEVNGAADLTENFALHPEVRLLNPAALVLSVRDGRFYGIPGEMHTMALFYNRRLFHAAIISKLAGNNQPTTATPTPAPSNRRRGRGAAEEDDAIIETNVHGERLQSLLDEASEVAKREGLVGSKVRLAQAEERPVRRSRAREEVRELYQVEAAQQQPAERRRGFFRNWFKATREEEPAQTPSRAQPQTTPRPTATPDPAGELGTDPSLTEPSDVIPGSATTDILPSDPNERQEIRVVDPPTPMLTVDGLPRTWNEFIDTAVKLTDHKQGIYGYAPVLFSREGGREFAQWGMQAGLRVMTGARGIDIALDVNSATGVTVVQFLKDLRWRYDVSPPAEMCFRDNLMRLFANGRLAMMMLPADKDSITTLLKMGLPMEDLGIAPLPAGPRNRKHLVQGRYYIINSQIDADRRNAAFKWLLFLSDAETMLIRQQFFHTEGELTGAPTVARFTAVRQAAVRESMRRAMRVPIFLDYENVLGDSAQLALEPPHFTDRFFESLAEDVRPMVENKDSDPGRDVSRLGSTFRTRRLEQPSTNQSMQNYLNLIGTLLNRSGSGADRTGPQGSPSPDKP
jgi:ABC-type glycerol-3-phosphate transport system substrate-binding protein